MVCNVEIKCDTNDKYGHQSFLISENDLKGESYNELYKVQFPLFLLLLSINKQYTDVPHSMAGGHNKPHWAKTD